MDIVLFDWKTTRTTKKVFVFGGQGGPVGQVPRVPKVPRKKSHKMQPTDNQLLFA